MHTLFKEMESSPHFTKNDSPISNNDKSTNEDTNIIYSSNQTLSHDIEEFSISLEDDEDQPRSAKGLTSKDPLLQTLLIPHNLHIPSEDPALEELRERRAALFLWSKQYKTLRVADANMKENVILDPHSPNSSNTLKKAISDIGVLVSDTTTIQDVKKRPRIKSVSFL